MPNSTQTLRYSRFGDPMETLELETIPLPQPADDEVTIRILLAPINPADFGRINGSYGTLANLPAVGGLEGVGEVVARGRKAQRFQIGSRVIFSGDPGSWQTFANLPETGVHPAPNSLDDEQAAMFWINPATAWRMLNDFADLNSGDWIIQNAATSAVGRLVIQFAAAKGIRTVNLVRNLKAKESLEEIGADLVVEDNRDAAKVLRETMGSDMARLGLNAVGGSSALTICKCLADQSALVTYGGMDRDPAPFPTRYLIFNDLRLYGFWVTQWYREASTAEIEEMHQTIAEAMRDQAIATPVCGCYALDDWKAAIEQSVQPGKPGKVLFKMNEKQPIAEKHKAQS